MSIPGRTGVIQPFVGMTFTAAGQTSPIIGVTPGGGRLPFVRMWPLGWEKFTFQLRGSGTGYAITAFGTIDMATAEGNGNAWQTIPGAAIDATQAGGVWANPMLTDNPDYITLNNKAPWRAIKFVSDNDTGATAAGSIDVLVFVAE